MKWIARYQLNPRSEWQRRQCSSREEAAGFIRPAIPKMVDGAYQIENPEGLMVALAFGICGRDHGEFVKPHAGDDRKGVTA